MKYLITGGAGFIGSNTAYKLLGQGHQVVILDNLSRPGSRKNLEWLRQEHGDIPFLQVDVRDYPALRRVIAPHLDADAVIHLAAQVAVTTSVANPREDLEINTLGTFNLLEAIREEGANPALIYASTNKVYGGMDSASVVEESTRYRYQDLPNGVNEETPLDFHSPYGCSKGAADQYVRDYYRIYGMRTVVFRQSCIYGPHQYGVEDQGWVAWFAIAAALGLSMTIYGDGKQVRDVLYIDDLAEAYLKAIENINTTQGQVYNIGGGPNNTISVWREFGPLLGKLVGREIPVSYGDWRPGDQKVFISDIGKAKRDFGWEPKVEFTEGAARLHEWVVKNRSLFTEVV